MDGISALERVMAINKNAVVIMVSALGNEELVKRSIFIGAKGFIVKPLDRDKVLIRITSVLKE
jgi:two-component system chemotaxis response regulator CheY